MRRMLITCKIYSTLLCCLLIPAIIAGQATIDPLKISESGLTGEIRSMRSRKPQLSPEDLAAAADDLLAKHGIGYRFSFDDVTCERLRRAQAQQKDPSAPVKFSATLKSVGGDSATLSLPSLDLASEQCGGCQARLPVLQITEGDFVTIIQGRNIKFHLPKNFISNIVVLYDSAEANRVERTWRVPFRSMPIGISHDGEALYLAFPESELADLALVVYEEGVFGIITRAEAEDGGKGKKVAAARDQTGEQRIRFDRWGRSYVVGYRTSCAG
jgi:hypothetical protein